MGLGSWINEDGCLPPDVQFLHLDRAGCLLLLYYLRLIKTLWCWLAEHIVAGKLLSKY
jgi:hypothetical protein